MKFMSGRALFTYNPDLFNDADDDEETKEDYDTIKEETADQLKESKEGVVAVD